VRLVVVVPGRSTSSEGVPLPVQSDETAEGPLVLVIDRQPLFLAALGRLLTSPPVRARLRFARDSDVGMEIVGEGGVALVFCDVRAEPIPALDLASRLSRLRPKVPVIVLGDTEDERLMTDALQSDAAGLFTKDAALDEFIAGVRAVLSGHRAVGANLMNRVLARLDHQPAQGRRPQAPLSPTELDILTMIGQAKSIAAIAASRGISHKTVRNHLANIYRKLELRSRTEAMLCAVRMGLVSQ
jgi:DNA-binding NarL/FixJ family response regulator